MLTRILTSIVAFLLFLPFLREPRVAPSHRLHSKMGKKPEPIEQTSPTNRERVRRKGHQRMSESCWSMEITS